ncbi:hypothetical protein [Pedobacter metabolipauper]|uniref:Uncharacterized protein n=1 Tax=Pedobacter metabolipauper TaxID=425513 RepID=A0A4R6SYY9_9SPHI|nr:hypothetical protein [Pedobacter metabolipauper]TDQ11235.1 hypothetical protein ATK78_0352 [Pedobacter metabolipauper]
MMKSKQILKYYRVDRYDTTIIEISIDDFKEAKKNKDQKSPYRVYAGLILALENAKADALTFINELVRKGEDGLPELLQYRIDHYEDLNINLIEANIRKIEDALMIDPNYQWQPYRIKSN